MTSSLRSELNPAESGAPILLPEFVEPQLRRLLEDRPPYTPSKLAPHAYASEAGACARQIGYRLLTSAHALAVPIADPPSLARLIAWRIGNEVHTLIQSTLTHLMPSARHEVRWDLGPVTGRCDTLYELNGAANHPLGEADATVAVEIKSMQPWTFRKYYEALTPAPEHILQAGLSALALGATYIHIIYLNKSPKLTDSTIAEFILPFAPGERVYEETLAELDRLTYIVSLTADGTLPTRFYNGDDIEDPETQRWPCGFCDYREQCLLDGGTEAPRWEPSSTVPLSAIFDSAPPGTE